MTKFQTIPFCLEVINHSPNRFKKVCLFDTRTINEPNFGLPPEIELSPQPSDVSIKEMLTQIMTRPEFFEGIEAFSENKLQEQLPVIAVGEYGGGASVHWPVNHKHEPKFPKINTTTFRIETDILPNSTTLYKLYPIAK